MVDYNFYKSMIRVKPTTKAADYRKFHKHELENVYKDGKFPEKEKPKVPVKKNPLQVHIGTMTPMQDPIPFSLFHQNDDIIRRDPRDLPSPLPASARINRKIEDILSRKTRPRIIMLGGGMSLDDISNDRAREIIIKDTYKTMTMDSYVTPHQREQYNIKTPLDGTLSKTNPTAIPHVHHQYVSPEWRMETVSWDRNVLRGSCDPTESFWLRTIKRNDENKLYT